MFDIFNMIAGRVILGDELVAADSANRYQSVAVRVDGSTIEGSAEYPTLSYNLVTVSGVENPLTAPVYMVKLNTASMKYAGRQDVTLTLAEIPGFALEVPAGSVTFPDGAREGSLSVTVVNSSKVPMPPPNGMQPQFIVTICHRI